MKKRLIPIFCSLAMLLSFSSCGKKTETAPDITSSLTTTAVSSVTTEEETTTTTTETTTEETTASETTSEETTVTTAETTTTAVETTTATVAVTSEETTTATTVVTTEVTTTTETVATTEATTTAEATTTSEVITTEATTTEETTTAETTAVKPSSSKKLSDMTTMEIVKDMGIGINLGNTYESCGDWIKQWGDGTPESYETAWGSPVITEKMIKGYADEGFGVLRVPVAWSNMMSDDYTISKEYAEAVKEAVDWALKYDLYVIVNLHYDNGWMENFPTHTENCMKKYKRIWEQVSEIFKDYDERLIFESQNEELGWSSVWNPYGGTAGKSDSYALVNEINQTFVDIVRSSGGNNKNRHLLISGYNTNIDYTCDSLFEMPEDPSERCALSVHYYTPSTFAILTEDADWGKASRTWGTASEINELKNYMDKLKKNFVDKGIPVIIGEYGCPTLNKDPESVRLFISSVCEEAYIRGMCPVLWSVTGEHYDRNTCKMTDSELKDMLSDIIA